MILRQLRLRVLAYYAVFPLSVRCGHTDPTYYEEPRWRGKSNINVNNNQRTRQRDLEVEGWGQSQDSPGCCWL